MRVQNKLFNLHNFTFPFKYFTGPSSALNRLVVNGPCLPGAASTNGPTHGRPGPARQCLLSPTVPDRGAQVFYLSIMPQAWLAISYGPRPRRTRLFIIKNTILNKQRINKIDYYKVGVFVRFVSLMLDVRFSNQL